MRGGRGGYGRGGGRGARAGASNLPPMGLSFQELGTLDKSPSKLYPETNTIPHMEKPDDKELKYASYQLRYLQEQKTSPYWPVLEQRTQANLTRFTDRYRPESHDPPSLRSVHMQKEVFPKGLWESFMEGETKREELKGSYIGASELAYRQILTMMTYLSCTAKMKRKRKVNWDSIDLEDRQGVSLLFGCI